MILGGIDDMGPALYIIDDNKVPQRVNFAALGSGSTDAIAMLEAAKVNWRRKLQLKSSLINQSDQQDISDINRFAEDIDIETAIKSVRQAVHAGIMNDLGSGRHIDICVIQKGGVRQWRESLPSEWEDLKQQSNQDKVNNIKLKKIGLFNDGSSVSRMLSDGDDVTEKSSETVSTDISPDNFFPSQSDLLLDGKGPTEKIKSVRNLGEMIFSRSKLSNFLKKDPTNESIIKKSEVRERTGKDATSCYIQKI